MSQKAFKLISGITTGLATIAVAVVSFCNPPCEEAIVAGIPLIEGCIIAVSAKFAQ